MPAIKPLFSDFLDGRQDREESLALHGKIAERQGQTPVGLPYAAGYAYGYHLIQTDQKKAILERL